jgi:thiol-disulfide isomerase/thioredoxin
VPPTYSVRTCAVAVFLLCLGANSFAGEPKPDAYEPKARQLLDEVIKNYQKLPGYCDQGQITLDATIGDKHRNETSKRSVTFVRPNKLVLDYDVIRLVCDGKTLSFFAMPTKQYAEVPAPRSVSPRSLIDAPLPGNATAFLFAGEGGLPMNVLVDLLGNDQAAQSILEGTEGLRCEAGQKLGEKTMKVLLVDQAKGPDLRLFVDPDSGLVPRIEVVYNLDELNQTRPKESKISKLSLAWNARSITNNAPEGAFAFQPQADFKKVEGGKQTEPGKGGNNAGADEPNPVDDLIGKPAPEFTLTVLDGPDKTKKVTQADLTGKVVMIDFWATWCGPCLKELPEVQKMIDDYAREKKAVAVIAVSEDDDPSELPELRKLVEKTLEEKKLLKLLQGPVSMVALDPTRTVGEAFKVEALPTVVLLDSRGVVRAAHVGGKENIREILTREIDTLLEGKSLPRPPKVENPKDEPKKSPP